MPNKRRDWETTARLLGFLKATWPTPGRFYKEYNIPTVYHPDIPLAPRFNDWRAAVKWWEKHGDQLRA
jgi:hypothetical protein